jgi:AraC family transcriptional regulator
LDFEVFDFAGNSFTLRWRLFRFIIATVSAVSSRRCSNRTISALKFRFQSRENGMPLYSYGEVTGSRPGDAPKRVIPDLSIPAGVEVVRAGHIEPFLKFPPGRSSNAARWGGIKFESYSVPAVVIPRHEHPEVFLHTVLKGSVTYEVKTEGRTRVYMSSPGTTFILPRGTVDEIQWKGPTKRVAASICPELITNVLDETAHQADIELSEHWDLQDPHITALLLEMSADLDDGSPAGPIYGESLANALAVYLLKRYAVRTRVPKVYSGGLAPYRLKRVLDFIGDNLGEDLKLSQLAALADLSPHYFSELFKQSTGLTLHAYVLTMRIEFAKEQLRYSNRRIIDIGLDAGFPNPSHFARVFNKIVGTSPSHFQAEMGGLRRGECPQ